jgi:predicted acyl esterase
MIWSSSFPMWEPKPNTGNLVGSDTHDQLEPAALQIFVDPTHPSRVVLPIVPPA